jgi:hypothetical protein
MNPSFLIWLNIMLASSPATPEERRAAFRVVQGGKEAA